MLTIRGFFIGWLVEAVFSIFLKLFFFHWLDLHSMLLQAWLFWFTVFIIYTAIIRRMGTLNYLEAGLISFCWTVVNIALDFFITKAIVSEKMFSTGQYWVGAFALVLAVFFFHRKRHVEIRKAKAHH